MLRFCLFGFGVILLTALHAQEEGALELLDTTIISNSTDPEWLQEGLVSGASWERQDLRLEVGASLVDQLQGKGGLKMFRRQSSLVAHPTSQGVALRVAGPNAASRAMVYRDGVPLNDPFGGWVPWLALSPTLIDSVSLMQPSGIDQWGNASFGGSLAVASQFQSGDGPFWSLQAEAGQLMDYHLSNVFMLESNDGQWQVYGHWTAIETQGHHVLRTDQRGAIDRRATVQAAAADFGVRRVWDSDWSLTTDLGYHDERRGNGTVVAKNSSQALQGSVRLENQRGADDWAFSLIGYYQQRDFDSVFTSVSAARDSERAVLDQYEVPSWAAGMILRSRHWLSQEHELLIGGDWRYLEGETNERFRNLGSGFTRRRQAGGVRIEGGLVGQHTWRPSAQWTLQSAIRLDYHHDQDGHEEVWNLETGARDVSQRFENRDTLELNARIGLTYEATTDWLARVMAFTGTRRPTLNELYRPFRVRNDITLANADLDSERLWGLSLGTEWEPLADLSIHAEAFYHWVDDAVANVTLVDGGGVRDAWGFIPDGGTGRQRRPLDRVLIRGLELSVAWQISPGWWFSGGYLLSDTSVDSSSDQPALDGNRLPQVAEHQAYAVIGYDNGGPLHATLESRWTSQAFDDDLNDRTLDDYLLTNVIVGWRLRDNMEVYATLENLFDTEIQTSRSGTGLIGIGQPRTWRAGVRMDF